MKNRYNFSTSWIFLCSQKKSKKQLKKEAKEALKVAKKEEKKAPEVIFILCWNSHCLYVRFSYRFHILLSTIVSYYAYISSSSFKVLIQLYW